MADNILLDAFNLKPAAAMEFIKRKGYTFSWNWFDTWKDAHAKAFTVAKVTKVEILRDIRNAVEKAISEGKTLQQFQKELTPTLQKNGWWGKKEHVNEETGEVTEYMAGSPRRLKTIYGTNLQTAYMAGRYKGQMDAAGDLPYIQYIAVLDGRTTDTCRDMHGRVFRADDPIWNTLYPPNHWGCRARTRSLSERMLQREGLRVESSEGRIVNDVVTVGKGENAVKKAVSGLKLPNEKIFWAGPGWNYNPGTSLWMPDLNGYNESDASSFIKDLLASSAYTMWIGKEGKIKGTIPVGVLPKEYVKAVGTDKHVVQMTADNYQKHRTPKSEHYHADIGIEDYQALQNIIEDADLIVKNGSTEKYPNTLLCFKKTVDGDFYIVPVRPNNIGEPEVRSLYKIPLDEVKKLKNKGSVIKTKGFI